MVQVNSARQCSSREISHCRFLFVPTCPLFDPQNRVFLLLFSPNVKLTSWDSINRLALGIGCCVVGGIGLLWLGLRHSDNYVWLLGSIFIPGIFNGLSGLISTFVNLYGSEDGVDYGATTIATLVITGGCTVICGSLAVIYTVLKIIAVRHHERQ